MTNLLGLRFKKAVILFFIGSVLWAGLIPVFSEMIPPTDAVAASEVPAEPVYVYKGDRFRDPFVPLTGQGGAWEYGAAPGVDDPFNPASVELKGILKTPTGRWAVLKTPIGTNFLVKNGKIYDSKRKAAPGYVGVVKEKELVIIGPNNQVTELKLKKDLDDAARRN